MTRAQAIAHAQDYFDTGAFKSDLGRLIGVVRDTARAVQEQAIVSDEIARNMDSVRHIATEVLSGSEESVVQAERLHELAFELEQSIGGSCTCR